jgi:hypothetical protein
VSRQVYAGDLDPEPPSDPPVDQGKTDRNTCLTIDHVIEITVPRVVVVLRVAGESLLDEEHPVDRAEGETDVVGRRTPRSRPFRQLLEPVQIQLGIELGIDVPGDLEGDPSQVEAWLVLEEPAELGTIVESSSHAERLEALG